MLVFISWSGSRSKYVALGLKAWLEQVIQATEPWLSADIDKGARWVPEVASKLENSKVGIICLTRENLESRWIHFEAGALSRLKDAHVCTILLGMKPSEIEHPLAQFQHTTEEKEDTRRLVQTINSAVRKAGDRTLSEQSLNSTFEMFWPQLYTVYEKALGLPSEITPPRRSESEILEEILAISRDQQRQQSEMRLELQALSSPRPDVLWPTNLQIHGNSKYAMIYPDAKMFPGYAVIATGNLEERPKASLDPGAEESKQDPKKPG